jgi:hypothetical protein
MSTKRKKEFEYSKHISKDYAQRRGWSQSDIENTILKSQKLSLSREVQEPHRLAIVYHHPTKPNQYIVRSIEGKLLQLSNLNRKDWREDSWRDNFLYLGKSDQRKRKRSHEHKK